MALPSTWTTKSTADAYELCLVDAWIFRSFWYDGGGGGGGSLCSFFLYGDYGIFLSSFFFISSLGFYTAIEYSILGSFGRLLSLLFNCFFTFSHSTPFCSGFSFPGAVLFYTIYSISFICINNVHHCIKCGNYWKRRATFALFLLISIGVVKRSQWIRFHILSWATRASSHHSYNSSHIIAMFLSLFRSKARARAREKRRIRRSLSHLSQNFYDKIPKKTISKKKLIKWKNSVEVWVCGMTDFHSKYDLRLFDICILIGTCAIRISNASQ